ncbi:putative disease resistance protein At3g14460 [Hibiscus syriacus]|nr:putative disease resistance protein At3g14460 [Hibiscus syriacus]
MTYSKLVFNLLYVPICPQTFGGSLQPPKDLQRLSISCYGATKFPSLVENPSFAKIEQLDLLDCINCKSFPSLGHLPSLRSLNVRGMHAVTKLGPEFFGNGFRSLEILRFENMSEWEEWIHSVGNIDGFPRLRELILHNCPRLAGTLPRTLSSLVKLVVQNCPRLTNSPLSFPFLGELTMEDSSSMILRSIVGQNITSLKLKGISDLTCIIKELPKALTKLEVLEIESCSELTCLWRNGAELQNLHRLKSVAVTKCPKLVSLVGDEHGRGLCCLSSLTDLRIDRCQKFESLTEKGLPCTMKCLTILDCKAMGSLQDMNGCNLEELKIMGCPSLVSFPEGKLLSTLKSLRIENCINLRCLPDGIVLNLQVLRISACMNLSALPNPMWNLISLRELSLSDCVALRSIPEGGFPPNITSLELSNWVNLKQPMSEWGLDKLNFLTELKIIGTCPATDFVSFPYEGVILPSTLTSLCLERLENLEYLSRELENLVDLQELQIEGCRKLWLLPKTALPASLGRLRISGCPVLRDRCRKEKGEYWSLICDIPCLHID